MGRALLAAAVALSSAAVAQPSADSAAASPAHIQCSEASDDLGCRVGVAIYVGRRVFHAHCASCHAEDGLGSDFAPELAPRIRRMTLEAFTRTLEDGYTGVGNTLPAWGENREVARYYRELWAYLNARATGELPPGPVTLR